MSLDPSANPARWLEAHIPALHVVLARSVPDPLLAFDLAAETLADAANRWTEHDASHDGPRLAWLLRRAQQMLLAAVEREQVPSAERRRNRTPEPTRLSDADLASLSSLRRHTLDLDPEVQAIADDLARRAPDPARLTRIRPSGLVSRAPTQMQDPTPSPDAGA